MPGPLLARLSFAARRLDARRIAALSVAIALHVVAVLLLLLPARPLAGLAGAVEELVVELIPAPAAALPTPPPPAVRTRPPASPPSPAPDTVAAARTPASAAEPAWEFNPEAGVTMVVYGERPALDLAPHDTPPAEIPLYRDAFDPSSIDGLGGANAGGSVVFDVLIDEAGMPEALVVRQQSCSERALETAMAVVGQWRFKPATQAGVPVQAWLEVALDF